MEHGGVMAKVRVAVELLRRCGHSPNLLYTATDQVPTGGLGSKFSYFLQHPRPYQTEFQGYPGVAFPHWPLPIWATYALPWFSYRKTQTKFPLQMVVSGAAHCGLPAALLGGRFIAWVSTLYMDELSGRALAGDSWAEKTGSGMSAWLLRREEKFVLESASLVLANGGYIADRIRSSFSSMGDKVRVVIYPVDTDVFRPSALDRTQPDPGPYLLFTGRINDPRKNVGMLFKAFARVREQRPNLRLILTGDTPSENVLSLAADSGVAEEVDFVGRQTELELVRLYQGAALFLLSSNQEGLGISVLEAMACGTPVVATRCGGPESVLLDGETGFMVPLNDDAAMAERILQLLSDTALTASMRENCVRLARETFSRHLVDEILLKAFHDVYPEHFQF